VDIFWKASQIGTTVICRMFEKTQTIQTIRLAYVQVYYFIIPPPEALLKISRV